MSGDSVVLTLLRELDEITVADRVRQATDLRVQERIDGAMVARVGSYASASRTSLTMRLAELEEEWDIERVLMLQSSATALTGLALAAGGHRRWLFLSALTTGFLLQHALQGWCPPLVLHRRLGFRTRAEIDLEIHMLKLLRGDFGQLSAPLPSAAAAASPAGS